MRFTLFNFALLTSNVLGVESVPYGSVSGRASAGRLTFSLPVTGTGESKRDFVQDWAATRQKWGSGIPQGVSSASSLADADGRVTVQPLGSDDIYIAEVEVGQPPQKLKLALDTGSSDVWVQSSDTQYQVNKDGPWAPRYQPTNSSSSTPINAVWNVQYVDGSAAHGLVYRDTIHLGGFDVQNATVESAQRVAARFESDIRISGIMGLAKNLSNNIVPPMPSFLELLKPLLQEPVFTVDLRKNATGSFNFGHLNTSVTTDDITWLQSNSDSPHWDVQLDLTAWTNNGKTWWYFPLNATIDTGTTLMFLPDELASMYWFDVPGMRTDSRIGGAFTFPCSGAGDLPDLMLKLPGSEHVITVPGPYMNYGPVSTGSDYCWGGMQSAKGLDVTILGDVMLKALFVAFDLKDNRIGFANKNLTSV